jgi:hypothetical protein
MDGKRRIHIISFFDCIQEKCMGRQELKKTFKLSGTLGEAYLQNPDPEFPYLPMRFSG